MVDFQIENNSRILREHTLNTIKIVKMCSELYSDIKINKMSVMPCHLNGDVHEWFNEMVTVPN